MKAIFIFILVSNSWALSTFDSKDKPKLKTTLSKSKVSLSKKHNPELEFYKARVKSLELMQKAVPNYPDIDDDSNMFRIGDIVLGELAFSVLSTNLSSPIVVIPNKAYNLPESAKILCYGGTKHKRVHGDCTKLVLPNKTVQIQAKLLSKDGSAGIRGDLYTGKEEYIAGMIASESSKGLLASQQQVLANGAGVAQTPKNALLGALISSADQTTDILREEMQTKEPKVFVKSRTKIALFIESFGGRL